MSAAGGAKRKIGGHFGSAVGASSSKKLRGGWREEEDEPDDAADKVKTNDAAVSKDSKALQGGDDESSEEIMDPGTPLPSEDEEEPKQAAEAAVEAAPESAADAAADAKESPAANETNGATAADGADDAPPSEKAIPVTVELDLVIGVKPTAKLHILLMGGLTVDVEERLKLCSEAEGAPVDVIAPGAFCAFAGHAAPKLKRRPGDGKVGDGDVKGADAPADSNGASSSASNEASVASTTNGHSLHHDRGGIASVPKEGKGLLLTFGPWPELDATHTVIGQIIIGRRAMRSIQALAPLAGAFEPRQPVTIRAATRDQQGDSANGSAKAAEAESKDAEENGNGDAPQVTGDRIVKIEHPFLLLEPAPPGMSEKPFSGDSSEGTAIVEILDQIELELDTRDTEIQELKAMAFNRERAEGVAAVETSLLDTHARLDSFTDLEEKTSHQREWQRERGRHLQRILQKLK